MDIYEEIRYYLLEGEAEEVTNLIEKAIKIKYPPDRILEEGLMKGINILADKFKTEMVLVPEALTASRALHAGLETLNEYLGKEQKHKGRVLIGTVEGDIHDIGKNLVTMLVSTVGLEVIDLGVDISAEDFVQGIKKYNPDILMLSSLLTTTMKEMKHVIKEIENANLREGLIIFVGGFPVTKQYAKEIGADYYTKNAMEIRDFLNENLEKILKQDRTNKSKIEQ
ncbi:MAG: cobalamin B12-binding domain-containing protein [Peptostreptococcaceae bacterium]